MEETGFEARLGPCFQFHPFFCSTSVPPAAIKSLTLIKGKKQRATVLFEIMFYMQTALL